MLRPFLLTMWEALGFIASGIVVGLIGRRFRQQYFREFNGNSQDPAERMNASLMRRGAAVFLTAGAMMVLVGGYFALDEIWNFLRQG